MATFLDSMSPGARRAFLVLCGILFGGSVFVLIPFWLAHLNDARGWPRWSFPAGRAAGVVLFLGGLALFLHCSRLFHRIGKGTPIPIRPPRTLVVTGLYRYSRNPIYVAQVAILLSYFLYSGQVALLVHAAAWAVILQAFIVKLEEPGLRKRFGRAYDAYTREVPRWIGLPRRAAGASKEVP